MEDLQIKAPTKQFSTDVAEIFGGSAVANGPGPVTAVRTKWIAVDVGTAAPANTLVATHDVDAGKLAALGDKYPLTADFSLKRPTKGWPVGKYRVDIELNGKPTDSAEFTIR